MSHFTVAVFSEENYEESIAELLAPYEEGTNDERFVEFVPADMQLCNEKYEKFGEKYKSFEDFMEQFYGCEQRNGAWGYYTNPNAKWDWYAIGGRWAGSLTLKRDKYGRRGTRSWTNENEPDVEGHVDSARVRDVEFPDDFCTFAWISSDGEWHANSEMGWFGMSDDDSDKRNDRMSELRKYILSHPDEYITIVDCHI